MFLNTRNIEFILTGDLERAKAVFEAAKADFAAASSNPSPGSPPVDSTDLRFAMDAYAVALREFNAFIVHGAIPARLREAIEKWPDSAREAQ